MRLLDKIEEEKRNANHFASRTNGERYACNLYFQHALQKIINDDLMKNNPDELFDEYREYFITKSLPTKIIDADTAYYRGRIGNEIIHGSYDECSYNFLLLYYKQEIEAPPSLFATGGRFNRSGTSYLYLSISND